MKVKELVSILNTVNQDAIVILDSQCTEELKSSELRSVNTNVMWDRKISEWGFKELTNELKKINYPDKYLCKNGEDAIVLVPM